MRRIGILSDLFSVLMISCTSGEESKSEKSAGSEDVSTSELTMSKEVDLGLPSGNIWAGWNLGADSIGQIGNYYSWGELEPKKEYTKNTYKYQGKILEEDIASTEYDVVSSLWGGNWHIPTKDDFAELINNCKQEWVTYGDISGYKFIGPNGKSIFFPAAGCFENMSPFNQNSYGYYWTSIDNVKGFRANNLSFYKGRLVIDKYNRYAGLTIRPVKSAK